MIRQIRAPNRHIGPSCSAHVGSRSVPPHGKLGLGRSGSRMFSLSEQLAELTSTEALA